METLFLWYVQWKYCTCGIFNGKKYYCGFSNSGNAGRSLNQGKKREWRVRELNWGDSEMEELFYCNEVGRDIRRVSGRKMENSCGPWGFITVGEGKSSGVVLEKGVGQSWEGRKVWWKNWTKREGTEQRCVKKRGIKMRNVLLNVTIKERHE